MTPPPPRTRPPVDTATGWWADTVGYEVYVRSFADADGDGIGDLPGLIERLPHIASVGVDFLWVTPFYPSPMHDHGYDVADYHDVDPRFGTLADADRLVEATHDLGLRVVIDLVANHTSSEHPWFVSARRGRDDPYRDHYIWRDPAPDGGPPNNWVSHFGGPAWSLDEASGQYWLHLFLPEQPDLNWANPAVADAFDGTLRFWLDRGVDGFRIDVAHAFVKDEGLRDNPLVGEAPPTNATARAAFDAFEHRYDLDQPGVVDVFRRWNRVAEPYGALLIGEVYLMDTELVRRYVSEQDALHLALCIPAVRASWDAVELHRVVDIARNGLGPWLAWPLSSHDDARAPTRFGGGERGRDRALAYTTLLAGLPGVLLLYQGDELALENGEIPPDRATDPAEVRTGHVGAGRDGVRTPMPWDGDLPGFGFGSQDPWLPVGRRPDEAVAAQERDAGSYLQRTRALLAARRAHRPAVDAALRWLETPPTVLAYRCGHLLAALNCGDDPADVGVPADAATVVASRDDVVLTAGRLHLPADTAVLLRCGPSR